MKIRTQFMLSTIALGIILLLVSASLMITNQWVENTRQQEILAIQIERQAYELGYLANDYLLRRESQQATRWESKFISFSNDLLSMEVDTPEQQAVLANIKTNQQRLEAVFAEVRASIENAPPTQEPELDEKFMQVSWSRLEVQNQGMIFDASRLAQLLREQQDQLRRLTDLLSFVLIGVLAAFLVGSYGLTIRRTLRAIAELQAGARIIGSGDLDFAIPVRNEDEIGELSRAFNQMTADLKQVTASKADLEQEITQRKRAEEHLRATNARLQEQAGELDAQAEELRVQTEELAATNNQLSESQQRYSTVFDKSPFAMTLTNTADSTFVGANNAFLELFELTQEEAIGKSSKDLGLADPGSRAQIAAQMRAQGSIQDFELAHTTKTGTRRILSLNMKMVSLDGGDHVLTTIRDVTERRRAEEALRQVNERLQAQAVELERQARELQSARLAALNLMDDALNAQEKVQQINLRLRESEQRLNRAQEIAHLGSWELDLLNNRLAWSDEVYRIFGLQPQEFPATYEAFLEAVHPDDRARVDEAYSGSIRDGKDRYEIEHRIINQSSGEVRFVHEKCDHFRDEAGQIIRSIGMVHDITEYKQAEEALKESEAKYRNLFENMTEEVHFWKLVHDEAGCIKTWRLVDANPPTLKTWGRTTVDEIRGKTTDEILGPGATEHYMPVVQKIISEGVPYYYEDYFPNLDRYFRFTSVPLGEYFITTGADITTIKKAEQALRIARDELEQRVQERTAALAVANRELLNEIAERREFERQLRIQSAAMEAAANGILITDPQGNILWTNPAVTQMSGYGADELVGQNTRIFNSGQHDPAFYRDMWCTILAGNVWKGETTNRRKDGGQYTEGQTITPVRSEEGEISHFIAIKEDITDKKQAEQEIRARNEKEKMLMQMIHTMQLDIARDLHDTLGQNISFLRMKLDYLTGKKVRKQADLQMEIRNMARAANESYDLMRGTLAILQSTDSADLYRLFTRYTEQIEERSGFKVDFCSLGESKPISAPRMRQLFYIFREILNNIEKHATASQVTIEMIWAADHLKLIVSDNGQGFDVNQVQFGSHYGLKFLRERVELLNGSLTLRSEPGSGTNVAVLIPYETS
ncbi:MAG TPA: PAS domain S-box protein [Anaerolineales bacterium]|nr:PAS domain S-box protein [Anaerolineales bacterium]